MFSHNKERMIPIILDNANLLANVSVSTELYINLVVNG